MRKILILILFLLLPSLIFSEEIGNYLILNDIGEYKHRPKRTTEIYGNSGILIPTGHFDRDHDDITYRTRYVHPVTIMGVGVEVTQHAGADSDKWLLHEVEDGYRDGEIDRLGLLTQGARLREINGNRIISLRGSGYSWISNNVVVEISYTDLYGNKPEPFEVVRAYLEKFPSTIPAGFVLDRAHDEKWIKDEMDRRLWLCDKWFLQLQLGKAEQQETLRSAVKSMFVFLDYREKYYGIKTRDEKILLDNHLINNDGTAIKNKLTEYKTWWRVNKTKSISLP